MAKFLFWVVFMIDSIKCLNFTEIPLGSNGLMTSAGLSRTTCNLNGSRYYIQFFFKANWHRASQFCRYNGMQLASINSAEDQFTLEKQLTELGLEKGRFWLSGNDLLSKGQFSWASNGRPFIFTRWWTGQPDNSGGIEDCVEMWEFVWNDNRCDSEFFFVCEEFNS